jgi:phosphoribosylformimino-5-aminoimidazole carboxamide ribotide isomerase
MPPFAIIPVLDLKGGEVVRARAGERASYRPIETPLAASSAPEEVLRGFRRLAPFRTFYVADLDAITGSGGNERTLAALRRSAPDAEFWVDGGFVDPGQAASAADRGLVPVLGSESFAGAAALRAVIELLGPAGVVLSLDWRGGRFLGAAELWEATPSWPDRLILMTLDRVGVDGGPDLAALERLVARANGRQIFAAGGVRGAADLAALRDIGVAGALVASSLHDGRLGRAEIGALLG